MENKKNCSNNFSFFYWERFTVQHQPHQPTTRVWLVSFININSQKYYSPKLTDNWFPEVENNT